MTNTKNDRPGLHPEAAAEPNESTGQDTGPQRPRSSPGLETAFDEQAAREHLVFLAEDVPTRIVLATARWDPTGGARGRGTYGEFDDTASHWLPDDADTLLKAAETATDAGRSVWVTPHPLAEGATRRRKVDARPAGTLVWADLDEVRATGSTAAERADRVSAVARELADRGAFVVLTGNGAHVYWRLDAAVPASEIESLNRRLQARYADAGADTVHDVSRLLRLAGSRNTKSGERHDGAPVIVLAPWSGVRVAPAVLRESLPPDPHAAETPGSDDDGGAGPVQIAWGDLPSAVQAAIENASSAADRSDRFAGVVWRMRDEGLSLGQAVFVAERWPFDGGKYAARRPAEVRRLWRKSGTAGAASNADSGPARGADKWNRGRSRKVGVGRKPPTWLAEAAPVGADPFELEVEKLAEQEYRRLVARDRAARRFRTENRPAAGERVEGGGLLDLPAGTPAVWGRGRDVLWAEGESLMIAGPTGVGKTTLTGQVVRARLGLDDRVLGLPVKPTGSRVLYLAMDRPAQIMRALARHFRPEDRGVLNERLVIHKGPPEADMARDTDLLVRMAHEAGADTVVVDSLKDAAIGLSDDAVGAGYNQCRQKALAGGVEVVELHHQVKRGQDGKAPKELADVYGSAHLTNGSGSVVLLWGAAGDRNVEFRHLKQPSSIVGPWRVEHDHAAGRSTVAAALTARELARAEGGTTVTALAQARTGKGAPSKADKEAARRELDRLTSDGLLKRRQGAGPGGSDTFHAVGMDAP